MPAHGRSRSHYGVTGFHQPQRIDPSRRGRLGTPAVRPGAPTHRHLTAWNERWNAADVELSPTGYVLQVALWLRWAALDARPRPESVPLRSHGLAAVDRPKPRGALGTPAIRPGAADTPPPDDLERAMERRGRGVRPRRLRPENSDPEMLSWVEDDARTIDAFQFAVTAKYIHNIPTDHVHLWQPLPPSPRYAVTPPHSLDPETTIKYFWFLPPLESPKPRPVCRGPGRSLGRYTKVVRGDARSGGHEWIPFAWRTTAPPYPPHMQK
ncbi:hypothetical protein B0H14DRAFT_2698852 [Mycena olivaceomarginata]|nr:hypothetical protein B0H14DRAFT_2698852 [Mycena olivaceomarginata]